MSTDQENLLRAALCRKTWWFWRIKGLGFIKKEGKCLFTWTDNDRTRGGWLQLKEERFRSEFRNKFFTQRVVRQCNKLPKEAVHVPSLIPGCVQGQVRWGPGQPDLVSGTLEMVWCWNWMVSKVSSNPNHSVIVGARLEDLMRGWSRDSRWIKLVQVTPCTGCSNGISGWCPVRYVWSPGQLYL